MIASVRIAPGLAETCGAGASALHALRELGPGTGAGGLVLLRRPLCAGMSTRLTIPCGLAAPEFGQAPWRDRHPTCAGEAAPNACGRGHVGFVARPGRPARA
jgi:hypothetical protein